MPEMFIILFDCYADANVYSNPKMYDIVDKCRDAQEALINFLDDHHISYHQKCLSDEELSDIDFQLLKLGIREYGG